MTKTRHICQQQIGWIGVLFILALVTACSPITEELPPITPISPGLVPDFLFAVYPKRGAILSLDDYGTAPVTRVVPVTGGEAGVICMQVDASKLIDKGDFWDFDDVRERTTILVDNQPTGDQVGSRFDYLVGGGESDIYGNPLSRVGGPYEWCVSAPLATDGVHRVDLSFEKSSSEVVSFAWTFELIDGPVSTSTPLPTPSEIDRTGLLPEYLETVYPLPGERVLLPSSLKSLHDTLLERIITSRYAVSASIQTADMQPICFRLTSELMALGTLPTQGYLLFDRVHFTLDDVISEQWLFPSSWSYIYGEQVLQQCVAMSPTLGEHIATLYIAPYDADLVVYSWAFTIEEP